MSVLVRLGLPETTGALPGMARELGATVLVSSNRMFDKKRGRFRRPGKAIAGLDVALDSAGFTMMKKHGRYLWTVEQYVELAGWHDWAWWAQMDLCCEPEIAADRQAVAERVAGTVQLLDRCRKVAREMGQPDPLPVLQGWRAEDYGLCVRGVEALGEEWPELVGVGSVCRRSELGHAGLHAVIGHLDRVLPRHVRLHLFGVKSTIMGKLAHHPRVHSVDSMAWDSAARWASGKGSCTNELRGKHMEAWWNKQQAAANPAQGALF